MITVRPLTAAEARRYFGDRIRIVNWSRALERDGTVIAVGGFADDDWINSTWLASSNWMMWCFLMVYETPSKGETVALIKAMRKALKEYGGTIYSECHPTRFDTAARLHEVLGFKRTGQTQSGKEVWRWNEVS